MKDIREQLEDILESAKNITSEELNALMDRVGDDVWLCSDDLPRKVGATVSVSFHTYLNSYVDEGNVHCELNTIVIRQKEVSFEVIGSNLPSAA